MESSSAREYLVILAGLVIGTWLMASTIYQLRRGTRFPSADVRLHAVQAAARLVLGMSLVLLAVFLLAGRTLWAGPAGTAGTAAPAWAVPTGIVILICALVSAVVAGAFAVAQRWRPKAR